MNKEATQGVPDAIHHTDTSETLEYITGWNDCRAAMLAAQQEPYGWHTEDHLTDRSATTYSKDMAYRWQCKGWPVTPLYTTPQAQPAQQEPVAWLHPANATCVTTDPSAYVRGIPLYTTPQPAQRTWVGLTDEERNAAMDYWSEDARQRYIEAKIKEKNT